MKLIKKHILIFSAAIGAFLGYTVFHPFGMIVHKIFHSHKDGYLHIHWYEILSIFGQAFSLHHWPQALSYIIFTGIVGYLFCKIIIGNRRIDEQVNTFSAIGMNAAGIIHDFKNPLNILIGCADYINGKNAGNELSESCEIMKKQIKRLSNMISNIKITAQSAGTIGLSKEQTNLQQFLQGIISNMMLNHGTRLNLKCDEKVSIDKKYSERVFWNLLNNADEALQDIENGKINITASETKGFITIAINDNGRGIPKETLKHLFEIGKTYGKDKGTGLGLYSCRKIIEAHKGNIWIDSEVNKGTTVFVNLPK
ncbi:MAG: HAMP domain-containing sensor histidine kinase [Candidatus Omnitrophota bacterium]